MKTTTKILKRGLIALALVIISCEKTGTDANFTEETGLEEGFMSHTENADSEIKEAQEYIHPLLHKRYDAALTRDEAKAMFRTEVSKFIKKNDLTSKRTSYVYYEVYTKTGNKFHSQTNGSVEAAVTFYTDQGWLHPMAILNNKGDDRQNGSWDFYYLGFPAPSISWLEAKIASIRLRGTDGWYLEYFTVRANPQNYYEGVSGGTTIHSRPDVWLDNTTSYGWNHYNTGLIGRGRLTF